MDGAAGWPLKERGNRTTLELARTPNLDAMARTGILGLARTIPDGMEPSSDNACMAILGYDPKLYHQGRAAIEARSMGIATDGSVVFRANLVAVQGGLMQDYSAGHITSEEAGELIIALNKSLGGDGVCFYPGVSYRHICKLTGHDDTLGAICTPPHDIPGKPVGEFLPKGPGSGFLLELMRRSEGVLAGHPVNLARQGRGLAVANMLWLFWGSGQATPMPNFKRLYGVSAAVTSAVDVLRGLALMMGIEVLDIPGVTDNLENDFAAQVKGALGALKEYDMVVIHVEAADEAGHAGRVDDKIEAIERVDGEIISQLLKFKGDSLRVLVMPDHLTPIAERTHVPDPVPFLMWGAGITPNLAKRMTETEAKDTGFFVKDGYNIMSRLVG